MMAIEWRDIKSARRKEEKERGKRKGTRNKRARQRRIRLGKSTNSKKMPREISQISLR